MILHPLYHWAPAVRRTGIAAHGLLPRRTATINTAAVDHVCLSVSPSYAWELSAAHTDLAGPWDCWQVTLSPDDACEAVPWWGNRITEIRVRGPIPPERLWLIGTRDNP